MSSWPPRRRPLARGAGGERGPAAAGVAGLPLHTRLTPEKFRYRLWARTVMRNYAGDTIWTWHGAYYLRLLWGQSRPEARENEAAFASMLEKYHTFPEVLQPDGSIYNSLVYKSSEGMIWAAIYLTIENYKPKS